MTLSVATVDVHIFCQDTFWDKAHCSFLTFCSLLVLSILFVMDYSLVVLWVYHLGESYGSTMWHLKTQSNITSRHYRFFIIGVGVAPIAFDISPIIATIRNILETPDPR